jgi:hypothetical protein
MCAHTQGATVAWAEYAFGLIYVKFDFDLVLIISPGNPCSETVLALWQTHPVLCIWIKQSRSSTRFTPSRKTKPFSPALFRHALA